MNYTVLSDELLKRKKYLSGIISEKTASLAGILPEGRLRCSVNKGRQEYYQVMKNDTVGRYIPKEQFELIGILAQKEYDRKVLQYAKSEYAAIENLLKKYRLINVDTYFGTLRTVRQKLIRPVSLPDDLFVQKWSSAKYEKKGFAEGAPEYYTANGLRVRSKSEILIAETFDRLRIPYHYEHPFKTRSLGVIYPDFTVMNMRTRKTYFWEHCGRMDDPEYCRDWLVRLYAYEYEGVFLGDRLIQSFETSTRPLNMITIERLIKHYLL